MKKLLLAALLSVAVLSACTGSSSDPESASAGVEDFSIEGTWSGEREFIHPTEGHREGAATMEVLESEGQTFVAEMTYPTPDGDITERFVGAMTPDANLMAGANPGGNYNFSVVDENTLDYCYTQAEEDNYLTVCGRLTKDEQ